MKLKILPYRMVSESARDIARSLGVKRLREHTRFRPSNKHVILNWGNSTTTLQAINWLNKPMNIANATNKLKAFQMFKQAEVSTPDFTTDKLVAQGWLQAGHKVVERHKLSGTNGEGIKVVKRGETLGYAPLYTRYQRKDHEYRVHVFKGQVIDVTEKRKRSGIEKADPYVRNTVGGWVYCRTNVNPPNSVKEQAIKAVQALGLDFGAVDVIENNGNAYVLEVNTSPGLQGSTLTKYVNAIQGHMNEYKTRRLRSYY